jgi:hypothetical protein
LSIAGEKKLNYCVIKVLDFEMESVKYITPSLQAKRSNPANIVAAEKKKLK